MLTNSEAIGELSFFTGKCHGQEGDYSGTGNEGDIKQLRDWSFSSSRSITCTTAGPPEPGRLGRLRPLHFLLGTLIFINHAHILITRQLVIL